jgi:hypothetical protein
MPFGMKLPFHRGAPPGPPQFRKADFSIDTFVDALNWFKHRQKAFGGTEAQVLQKFNDRRSGLPDKTALKAAVKASGTRPVTYRRGEIRAVNRILADELAEAMQYGPNDKNLSADVIQEMWPTSMILADFCQCLQLLVPGTRFNMGPLKGFERMAEKVVEETKGGYDYEIAKLNDAYRASIVCRDEKVFAQVLAECQRWVHPRFGIWYDKKPKNKFELQDEFLGYGDFTYWLNFREVAQTTELQIHHLGVIFGKTAEKKWGYGEIATYSSLAAQYQIPGGLGHKFYEDYRKPATTPQQKAKQDKAKELSIRYYGICQGKRKATPEDIKEFKQMKSFWRFLP